MIPVVFVLPLRWLNPATTAFVLQDSVVESVWVFKRWSSINEISPVMQMAVIAAEDQRFPEHNGFDFVELKKALSQPGGPKRGASTISQQLVKNLFLWSGKSIFRKLIEAGITMYVEWLVPKERILELYLNIIEFGPGIYGVQDASKQFFGKKPEQLNRIDASLLAAVLPNPKTMRVDQPSPYVYERALDIRFAIRNLGGTAYLKEIQ